MEKDEIKMANLKKPLSNFFVALLIVCLFISIPALAQEPETCPESTLTGNFEYDPRWLIRYDPEGPIDPGECVEIEILKGCPPFTWTVTENDGDDITDFFYDPNETGPIIQICSSNDAYGSAFGTATDFYSQEFKGSVRSLSGRWPSWTLKAEVTDEDMGCPGNGSTYKKDEMVCKSAGPAYQYRARSYRNGDLQSCGKPYRCGGGERCTKRSDGTGGGNACYFEISDDICSFSLALGNCGGSRLQLYQKEWICD